MTESDDPIPTGSVWRERTTNRLIRVTVTGDFPTWVYLGPDGSPVPHGYEPANGLTYDDWYEHRCDALDFVTWDRFERVS